MKRWIAFFLCVTMALSLAACAKDTPVSPTTSQPAAPSGNSVEEPAGTDFPTGPITLVCPWKAGAGADTICRMFESMGQEYFGVPIVVENQDGAAGVTATVNYLNGAKNDGYTVLFNNGGVFTSKSLMDVVEYSIDDFQPICGIVKDVNVLIVSSKLGVSTFEEFIKKYSGTGESLLIGCATAGIPHVCMAQLFQQANVTYTQVAYNGASEITTALLGGHVDAICIGTSEIGAVKDTKDAVILTAFADKTPQVAGLEDVPPVTKFGYNVDTCVWRMLLVQKGTPDEVLDILYNGFTKMIQDPRFESFATENGLMIDIKTPEQVTAAVHEELDAMIPVFEELKLGRYADK